MLAPIRCLAPTRCLKVLRQLGCMLAVVAICQSVSVAAENASALKLNGMFADHMVFQQQCQAPVWGTAGPGTPVQVTASWSQSPVQTKADADGKWSVSLQTPEAGGPYQVVVRTAAETKQLKDVLVGEVWICSGQSNMQWKMRGFGPKHFEEDVKKAKYPNIRFCSVPQVIALEGQDDIKANWTACNPSTAMNFSAVGYFFGSRLHQELDTPIGLISTNWGGSSAQAWVSPEVLQAQFPEFNSESSKYAGWSEQTGVKYGPRGRPKGLNQRSPSVLYNGMIRPMVPFAFRGVVWYQGESNVTAPEQYRTLFPTMIRNWRDKWGGEDFPFYYVQIAPFSYKRNPMSAAFLREAQTMALSEPNTGMVVTMDVGDPTNIHPKDKKPVGERLARLALANDYGRTKLVDSGPMYESHRVRGKTIRLAFTELGSGLTTNDGQPPSHFTIAGADRKFVEAEARIDGDSIVVQSPAVTKPVAVRYGWGSADMPNLCNEEGLPAPSFRTDDWPIK